MTPIGGLILAILVIVDSQTHTSATFNLLMGIFAAVLFLIDIVPQARNR